MSYCLRNKDFKLYICSSYTFEDPEDCVELFRDKDEENKHKENECGWMFDFYWYSLQTGTNGVVKDINSSSPCALILCEGQMEEESEEEEEEEETRFTFKDFVDEYKLSPEQLQKECAKLIKFATQKKKINSRSFVGNKLIYHYQQVNILQTHRQSKSGVVSPSFKEYIEDNDNYDKLLAETIKRGRTGTMPNRIKACFDINKGSICAFKAAQSMVCYKECEATQILDPTAGWGGRLLGAWAMGLDYTGIDTNIDLKEGYDDLITLLHNYDLKIKRESPKLAMIYQDTLEVDYDDIEFDCVLTSFPYCNLEVYQNMTKFEDDDDYLFFLTTIFGKCVEGENVCDICINVSPSIWAQWNKEYEIPKPDLEIELKQQTGQHPKADKVYIWRM